MSESNNTPALLHAWLAMPMDTAERQAIERVRRADDVVHVAVMPDVHLAGDVCVGTAMATRRLLYPAAVGGDIGCGMLAISFDGPADLLRDAACAGAMLRALGEQIPAQRRHRSRITAMPGDLSPADLSHPQLKALAEDEGKLQLGTLGGGNHFVEMQADEDERLWLMIHSGSRAMGQAIKAHHVAKATIRSGSMMALDLDALAGQAYLNDQNWARKYASANRHAMMTQVIAILRSQFKLEPIESSLIVCDHNHVSQEEQLGQSLLIHRKGAMPANDGLPGVVPGSMGTMSFHVEGRGCAQSLMSSAHGAGRLLSRHAARERFTGTDLRQQMHDVWFDPRLSEPLREESPKCYKDVQAVLRAQSELVKITRKLRPMLVYKAR